MRAKDSCPCGTLNMIMIIKSIIICFTNCMIFLQNFHKVLNILSQQLYGHKIHINLLFVFLEIIQQYTNSFFYRIEFVLIWKNWRISLLFNLLLFINHINWKYSIKLAAGLVPRLQLCAAPESPISLVCLCSRATRLF